MKQEQLKHIAYLRKSSESEERQALSIPAQKDKIKEYFPDLKVIQFFEESHSAFYPHNRPLFARMIEMIEKGEADGIVTWHPDRLSRNEVDAATITYMLRQGKIKDLKFGSYNFTNDPSGIWMLQMALSQSQYQSAKLGVDVKRGVEKKLRMGWLPSEAPTGYLNYHNIETGINEIKEDPERFEVVRKMWDLMLTGNYNPTKIVDIANNDWGFRTIKRRKRGGGPLARSSIYAMFTNMFYAGVIERKGVAWEGNHKKMISLEEFDKVQMLLGRKGKARPKTHNFSFTGMIRCEECGCLYTAETKTKMIKSNNKLKSYTFYHCTRKKKELNCSQRKWLRIEKLEKQIKDELEKVTIIPEFRTWALEVINENNDREIERRTQTRLMKENDLANTQKEMDSLTKMRFRELLDDVEYLEQKKPLKRKIDNLRAELKDIDARTDKWLELTERTFDFATYAYKAFIFGDYQVKKEIFANLGQNFLVKDGILRFEPNDCFVPIKNRYKQLEQEYKRLEPALAMTTTGLDEADKEALRLLRLEWRARPDSNR